MLPSDDSARNPRQGSTPGAVESVVLPHGVAVGDVTADSAVFWTRTEDPAVVHLEYGTDPSFEDATRVVPRPTQSVTDNTVKARATGLDSGTTYHYRLWAYRGRRAAERLDPPTTAVRGTFQTAPAADADESVSFVWSGDTFGQGRWPPYQVLARMIEQDPDFFLYLGDTIYADSETPAVPDGTPTGLDDYRAKYREMREEASNLRDLLRATSVVTIWDDHEVKNDWAGSSEPLLPDGRQAFLEYWPIDEHPDTTGESDHRLYRSFRWGADVELFVLDSRQYRDDNTKPDGPDKTMLGAKQREWLKDSLRETDATFALVASSTSVCSVSSGAEARDGWATGDSNTGFEHELRDVVRHVRDEVESTVVFLTGDRHCARLVSYDPDRDGSPEFHEALASPIGAAPRKPEPIDETFGPTLHYEEGGKYELGEFYNFGRVDVDGDTLTIGIYDKVGERRAAFTIDADGSWPSVEHGPQDVEADENESSDSSVKRLLDTITGGWK